MINEKIFVTLQLEVETKSKVIEEKQKTVRKPAKGQKRRKLTKKQRALRRRWLIGSLAAVLLLVPVVTVVTLWWRGWLPTREELPRYKEKILIVLSGWGHARLPEGEVIGIDISHYQGTVDWEELCFYVDKTRRLYKKGNKKTSRREVDFVVAKATQGARYRDNKYKEHKQGARERNILFGAYHFYSWKASAKAQADNFIRTAQLQSGDLVPILDVEMYEGRLPERDSLLVWLNTVEKYYNRRPVIYTGENCYLTYLLPHKEFSRYAYWIARYGGQEPSRHHIIWQCSENGKAGGVKRPVDLNVFRGTKADMIYKYTLP